MHWTAQSFLFPSEHDKMQVLFDSLTALLTIECMFRFFSKLFSCIVVHLLYTCMCGSVCTLERVAQYYVLAANIYLLSLKPPCLHFSCCMRDSYRDFIRLYRICLIRSCYGYYFFAARSCTTTVLRVVSLRKRRSS